MSAVTTMGVSTMDVSAGEAGGIFAGVIAACAALGKGIAWLLNWHGERSEGRTAKLQAWEDRLNQRERAYRESIEGQLRDVTAATERMEGEIHTLQSQQAALTLTVVDVTAALQQNDPRNPALRRAATSLRAAFPVDHSTPPHLVNLIEGLDHKDS